MNDELKNAFDILDINTKRNQLNDELLFIYELIKEYEQLNGMTPITNLKKYSQIHNKGLTEGEFITFFYEQLINIQMELIFLLDSIIKNKKA